MPEDTPEESNIEKKKKAPKASSEDFDKIVKSINKYNKNNNADFINDLKSSYVRCSTHKVLIKKGTPCPGCERDLEKIRKQQETAQEGI